MNMGTILILCNVAVMFHDSLTISSNLNFTQETNYLVKYRQLQIVSVTMNQGFFYVIPVGLGCSFVCSVASAYVVIKFFSVVPLATLTPAVAIMSSLVGMSHVGLDLLGNIGTRSANFVRYFGFRRGREPYWRRKLRSYSNIGFRVGQFTTLGKKVRVNFLSNLLYYTATALISSGGNSTY